jgi:hypothetical protein
MELKLTEQAEKALNNYKALSGKSSEDILNRLVETNLTRFIPEEGFGNKAVLIEGNSKLVQKVAEATGEKMTIIEQPCTILGKTQVFGNDYYVVYTKNNSMKIPAGEKMIRLESGEYL